MRLTSQKERKVVVSLQKRESEGRGLVFAESLFCAGHFAKLYMFQLTYTPSLWRDRFCYYPDFIWGNWDLRRSSNLCKVKEKENSGSNSPKQTLQNQCGRKIPVYSFCIIPFLWPLLKLLASFFFFFFKQQQLLEVSAHFWSLVLLWLLRLKLLKTFCWCSLGEKRLSRILSGKMGRWLQRFLGNGGNIGRGLWL